MGGHGSGRTGGSCTIEGTACYSLSAKALKSIPHGVACKGKGSWTWSDGFEVDYELDATSPNCPFLKLTHYDREGGDDPISYEIYLTASVTPFGGKRWWFLCPNWRRRAFKLYLPNGGRRFLCRQAYRLGYACQRETRVDRLMRKARKLHRALGGHGEEIGEGWVPPKPKWMRWRTYARKAAAWEAADISADNAWGAGAMRFLQRLGAL